jgi:hypothetical protein
MPTHVTHARARLLAAVLAGALAACNTAQTIVVGDLDEVIAMRALPSRDLDVLFVIDNSPSMADKQLALAATFPRMIEALVRLDGGLPDLHIGVISSDLGTLGSAVATPGPQVGILGSGGCTGVGDDGILLHAAVPELGDGFLSDVADPAAPGGRARNYAGDLRDVFGALARLGDGGCGFEQPLAAMRRALTHPANAGFLRAEANLAVVIISDEDDCSLLDPALLGTDPALGPLTSFRCFEHGVVCKPDAPRTAGDKQQCQPRGDSTLVEAVAPFVDALIAAKGDPRRVMVAGIVGDPAPVHVELTSSPAGPQPALRPACTFAAPGGPQIVDPAVRLAAFLDGFPGRSQRTSLCQDDLVAPLERIGETARRLVGDPCVDTSTLADASDEPGVQPACEVTEVRDAAPDRPTALPSCGDGPGGDCYAFVADAHACPAGDDHLRLRLSRTTPVSDDTWTHVRCLRAP